MAFMIFTEEDAAAQAQRGRRLGKVARVAIMKQGSIEMNAACLRAQFHGTEYVQVLFDSETRRIAVKPATSDDEDIRKLSLHKCGKGSFSASPFLRCYNISYENTFSYTAEWLDAPGAFVINLSDNKHSMKLTEAMPSPLFNCQRPLAFKLFKHPETDVVSRASITITRAAKIELNPICIRAHFKDVTHVQLLHDQENRLVAVKRATADDENTIKIFLNEFDRGRITGNAFLKHNKIFFEKTFRYFAEWFEDMEAYVIKLDDSSPDNRSVDGKPGNDS